MVSTATLLTEKVLKDGDAVHFTAHTPDYGLAEFAFCAQWKRGKIARVYVYPMQQMDADHFYVIESGYSDGLMVSAMTHKGMSEPWTWRHLWCKDHKCQRFDVYVPREATQFHVSVMSTMHITFEVER